MAYRMVSARAYPFGLTVPCQATMPQKPMARCTALSTAFTGNRPSRSPWRRLKCSGGASAGGGISAAGIRPSSPALRKATPANNANTELLIFFSPHEFSRSCDEGRVLLPEDEPVSQCEQEAVEAEADHGDHHERGQRPRVLERSLKKHPQAVRAFLADLA